MHVQSQPDKRDRILNAAEELFATQPFHKVLLSDVAAAAGVGKGTVYLYFKSKEDLYVSLLYRGFAGLVDRMRARLANEDLSPVEHLRQIVQDVVERVRHRKRCAEMLRGPVSPCTSEAWELKRREMRAIVESVLRSGVEQGVFLDPHPELTAHYILGMAKSVHGIEPEDADPELLTGHLVHFILASLTSKEAS